MNVVDIIQEVKKRDQARKDAELAREHAINRKMQMVFEQLNYPLVRSEFDHPHCDHLANGIDINVTRGGQPVCKLGKHDGRMKLETWISPEAPVFFDEPEAALRRIIELLLKHKQDFPIETLEEIRLASQYRPTDRDAWLS